MVQLTEAKLKTQLSELETKLKQNQTQSMKTQLKELETKLKQNQNQLMEEFTRKLQQKDAEIAELKRSVEELTDKVTRLEQTSTEMEKSCTYQSDELITIKGKVANHKFLIDRSKENLNAVTDKTRDLEDRSRRANLVFFNVPESVGNQIENPEKLVLQELVKCGILNEEEIDDNKYQVMDRVHRLGRRKGDQTKPRPIIVKMTTFKDKQYILRNSFKLKDSKMNVSEDYSKATLDLHRRLVKEGKAAKEYASSPVKSFRITYRRISLKYEDSHNKQEYFKSFSLDDIMSNPQDWFKN